MDNRVDKIRTVELFTVPRIAQCYCVHLNGCIDDNNVVYTTKIEGYTTSMSYMNELGEMPDAYEERLKFQYSLYYTTNERYKLRDGKTNEQVTLLSKEV